MFILTVTCVAPRGVKVVLLCQNVVIMCVKVDFSYLYFGKDLTFWYNFLTKSSKNNHYFTNLVQLFKKK